MRKSLLIFLAIIIYGCTTYITDAEFIPPANANMPDFPFYVNDKMCENHVGQKGGCFVNIFQGDPVKFLIPAMPYAYKLLVKCTYGYIRDFDIDKNIECSFKIPFDSYGHVSYFDCVGRISPADRLDSITAKWRVAVNAVDRNYKPRGEIQFVEDNNSKYLYFGQHAKHVTVCKKDICKQYSKKPLIKLTKKDSIDDIFAFSESEIMRFNYFGRRK